MKAHLVSSDDPLLSGQDHMAVCGVLVPKAEFVLFVDGTISGSTHDLFQAMNPSQFCRHCRNAEVILDKRYLYALVAGEELKHQEEAA